MVRAAVDAAPGAKVIAVTVSLRSAAPILSASGWRARFPTPSGGSRCWPWRPARTALVCSPREVAEVRAEVGPDILLVTPGIRPEGTDAHDQARFATPEDALRAGADLLVVGRPITAAPDPGRGRGCDGRVGQAYRDAARLSPGRVGLT